MVPMEYYDSKEKRVKVVDEKLYLLMPELFRLTGKVNYGGQDILTFTDREPAEEEREDGKELEGLRDTHADAPKKIGDVLA